MVVLRLSTLAIDGLLGDALYGMFCGKQGAMLNDKVFHVKQKQHGITKCFT